MAHGVKGENAAAMAFSRFSEYWTSMSANSSYDGRSFLKMHGAGNDFVIIDSRGQEALTRPALARALGDRHRGVGFDQLAEIRDSAIADAALDFWNNDGSRAGACGNATRCVAHLLMEESGRQDLTLQTERGLLRAARLMDGRVSVNMGHPQLTWDQVPVSHEVDLQHLPLDGDPVAVGMGNPHCVFFVEDAETVDLMQLGPEVEHAPLFPHRTNVEVAHVLGPDRLRMRVWERGTGVTFACGSGACATAVAAHQRGLVGRRVILDLDGGTLEVDWRDDGVWLTGPVALVFTGQLSASFLASVG